MLEGTKAFTHLREDLVPHKTLVRGCPVLVVLIISVTQAGIIWEEEP